MKRIAILTIFNNNNNYGGVLQAYALQHVLREKGYIAEVIVYVNGQNPIYKSVREQLKQYKVNEIIHKALGKVEGKIFNKRIINILQDREYLFDNFRKVYISSSKPYDDNSLVDSQKIYDAYICGSDQIWNPNAARNGFLLSMIDEKHCKIAYAASIGRSTLTEYEKSIMIPLIKRFDFVSVREKTAQEILNESGVNDVNVVLDPTLLIDKVEWESICNIKSIREKYVLCYFFSDSRAYRTKIEKYCKQHNLKLYYIPYANQSYTKGDAEGDGICLEKIGPIEFLSYINQAECVFTDSFHGTVFSILFEKKFVVFEREQKKQQASKNSRLYDLLECFNLKDRLYSQKDIKYYMDTEIEYQMVNVKLRESRKKSLDFLWNSLNGLEK